MEVKVYVRFPRESVQSDKRSLRLLKTAPERNIHREIKKQSGKREVELEEPKESSSGKERSQQGQKLLFLNCVRHG